MQLDLFGNPVAEERPAEERQADAGEAFEAAVAAVLALVVRDRRGDNPKGWDSATPTRIAHLAELVGEHGARVVIEASSRLNASGWLKKPARAITAADMDRLAAERPWEGGDR